MKTEKEYNDRIMFLGMKHTHDGIMYRYVVVGEDNILGREYNFKSKLFTRGSVGAIYSCSLEGSSISYQSKTYPAYAVQTSENTGVGTSIFYRDVLNVAEIDDRQAQVIKRNSTKNKSSVDVSIDEIREVYKNLKSGQRARFIADVVYKITR